MSVRIYYNLSMAFGEKSTAVQGIYTFSDVVDEACEKLMDRQIRYSIRRIQEMEDLLADIGKELDTFLQKTPLIEKTDPLETGS